jgi:predicted nucleic acid-binding protein
VRIVVDTNIVFSAILNTNSKIASILLYPKSKLNFYSTYQLFVIAKSKETGFIKHMNFVTITTVAEKAYIEDTREFFWLVDCFCGCWGECVGEKKSNLKINLYQGIH